MNGSIQFKYLGTPIKMVGGRYRERPQGTFGVKMAEEIGMACNVDIPTVDFSIPPIALLKEGMVKTFRHALYHPEVPIYVGCMGGIGRTGLFLAAFAKMVGVAEPVKYVRSNYLAHAVETRQQQDFIKELYVDDLKWQLRWIWLGYQMKSLFTFKRK